MRFIAFNTFTNFDDEGDAEDWVELYNPTDNTIQLEGYFLSDNPLIRAKWTFPEVNISAHGYLLVWLSGKNQTDVPTLSTDESTSGINSLLPILHTNFQLDKNGENIFLSYPDETPADTLQFPVQSEDHSYGRSHKEDGQDGE